MDQSQAQTPMITLSAESIDLILQDLRRYREPIAQALLKYLLEGGDDTVLQQLRESYMVIPDERSMEYHYWSPSPSYSLRCQMLHTLTTQDIDFYYRLTRLYAVEAANLRGVNLSSLGWLKLFLLFLVDISQLRFFPEQPLTTPPVITAFLIEALLLRVGESADSLARLVFIADPQPTDGYADVGSLWVGASLPEFTAYGLKHQSVLEQALRQTAVAQRIHALNMLSLCQMPPLPFATLLVNSATANSKPERAAALTVLQQDAIAIVPFVQAKAETGKASERANAARLLLDLIGTEARSFLESRLEQEQTATVQDTLRQVLTDLAILSQSEAELPLSPLPPVTLVAPLPASTREALKTALNRLCEYAQDTYEKLNYQQYPEVPFPQPPTEDLVDRVFECLQFGTAADCLALAPPYHYLGHLHAPAQFHQLLKQPELDLIHVTRLLLLLQLIAQEPPLIVEATLPHGAHWKEADINSDLQQWCQHREKSSLRYLTSGLEALGISGDAIAWKMLTLEESPFWSWGEQAIWEYFAERLSILDQLFALGSVTQLYFGHEQVARRQLFRVLAMFPQLPKRFIPQLWEIALNGIQAEMLLAQRCLDHRPGTLERLHQLIHHNESAIQLTAMQWLTRLKDHTAIPQLQTVLRRQVTGSVRDQVLRSLEKLGATIDEFLDRSQLLQESQTKLRKGVPKALSWFPFDSLPSVYWQDSNAPVAAEILTWFVVQSYQQKNPEPSPVLRQYVKLWKTEEREQFGQFILESWIHQDTQVTSAVKEKGVLAVAGACGGAAMVPVINHYLKTYFGNRLAQCLALVQMLTWSDDFAAIQLLLAIANRFRTQKIQEAAQQAVQQLAERQGWTLAELGDRTIPWCGLAENGTLILDYGARQFTAALDAECKLILTNESGKALKSLPTANQGDAPEQVKAAKQQWTATKKQVELVRSQQQARLYEALCTQRSWTFADWELFLDQHPIVGRLCQRLIWAVFTDDSEYPTQIFRPQADGCCVNAENHAINVSPSATIRLAHAALLPDDLTQSWQTHLSDAQITPLFANWATIYPLPPGNQEIAEIQDFVGYSISRHSLRQRAMQQGYLPKTEEFEHGATVEYRKAFESINLEVVIDFSGDYPVSTEEFDVQLGEVYFWQNRRVPLVEISPVLLSVVWSEISAIATPVKNTSKSS